MLVVLVVDSGPKIFGTSHFVIPPTVGDVVDLDRCSETIVLYNNMNQGEITFFCAIYFFKLFLRLTRIDWWHSAEYFANEDICSIVAM